MANQEKLLKEIKLLSDSIRQKNRALKLGIAEREKFLETTFKPITDPLKKITQNVEKPFEGDVITPISKYEEESQDEDGGYQQLPTTEGESEDMEETEEASKEMEEYSTAEEEEEESTHPSNLSKLGIDIVSKGTLGRKYLLKMLHSTTANRNYHNYGARVEDDGLMIGDSKLDIDENDHIIIGGKTYKSTPGLFELIFKNKPGKYTKKDLILFKNILEETNAHKKGYLKNKPVHRNRSIKYTSIIANIFPSQVKKKSQIKRRALSSAELNVLHKKRRTTTTPTSSGRGLSKNLYDTNIIYYKDINKLVDRMRLLYEAKEAGHTGLENEWVALIDELRNRRIIA